MPSNVDRDDSSSTAKITNLHECIAGIDEEALQACVDIYTAYYVWTRKEFCMIIIVTIVYSSTEKHHSFVPIGFVADYA